MGFLSHDDLDRWCVEQPVRFHVPSRGGEHRVPGGRQGGEIGDGRPGDESAPRAGRQTEQIGQPAQGDVLQTAADRRTDPQAAVLVPGGGQPARRHRLGEGPADHEAEEPAACGRERRRRAQPVEHGHRLPRRAAGVGQGLGELRQGVDGRRVRAHPPVGQGIEVAGRALGRVTKHVHRSPL